MEDSQGQTIRAASCRRGGNGAPRPDNSRVHPRVLNPRIPAQGWLEMASAGGEGLTPHPAQPYSPCLSSALHAVPHLSPGESSPGRPHPDFAAQSPRSSYQTSNPPQAAGTGRRAASFPACQSSGNFCYPKRRDTGSE